MTRNEKIAEVMGWSYYKKDNIFFQGDHWLHSNSWEFCKLLQARMQQDGWIICMQAMTVGKETLITYFADRSEPKHLHHIVNADTEPAALFELFCKVNGITDKA